MQVDISRKVYGKKTFTNVIDTSFNQLIPKTPIIQEDPLVNIDTFFNNYDDLFYQIPTSGSDKSHLELINRSSDYLGISLTDLEEEINNLRLENVNLKNQIFILTNQIEIKTTV